VRLVYGTTNSPPTPQRIVNADVQPNLPTDPVSGLLRAWLLPGWFAGLVEFDAPWGIAVPEGLGSLFVVLAGRCHLSLADGSQPAEIEAGDVLLLSQGAAYRLQDDPETPTVPYPGGFRHNAARSPTPQDVGGSTRLVFGHFSVTSPGADALNFGFGPLVRLKAETCPVLRGYRTIVEAVEDEQNVRSPGWQALVDHLIQTLLLQTLRTLILQNGSARGGGPDAGTSLFKAALDDAIGPALELIHRRPKERWTVTALASYVNISKSAFSERFHDLVGKPPLRYLTDLRIQNACRLLLDTQLGVKEVAALVGYESASSFSNAFKRCTGKSPAEFRKRGNSLA